MPPPLLRERRRSKVPPPSRSRRHRVLRHHTVCRRRPFPTLLRRRQQHHTLKLKHRLYRLAEEAAEDDMGAAAEAVGEAITARATGAITVSEEEVTAIAPEREAETRPEGGTCTIRRGGVGDITSTSIITRSRSRSTRRRGCRTGTSRRTCRGRPRSWRSSTRGSWWS